MVETTCVGALVRDDRGRVLVQHRTPTRRVLPDTWDIIGGHVEAGESVEEALAREVEEETGWRLRRVECVLGEWDWVWHGRPEHEVDHLVEVDGDLSAPRMEEGRQDRFAWLGPAEVDLMMEGRTDGDRRLRDLVARGTRLRLTDRMRLEPIGADHADALHRLHADPGIARWYGGAWSPAQAREYAEQAGRAWEQDGVAKWLAHDRVDGRVLGRGGISRRLVDGATELEVGWALREAEWGRGLATEIGRAAVRFATEVLGARRLVALTEVHNRRSRAVMERLGMRQDREFRQPGLVKGRDGVQPDAAFTLHVLEC